MSSLHAAVQSGQFEDIETLLLSGAALARDLCYGESAFHFAAKRGDVSIIQLLLNHGFNKDTKDSYYSGNSPLHLSCRHSCVEAVNFFFFQNADVCAQNNFGETPFHLACEAGNLDIIRLFINLGNTVGKGADLTARNEDGLTPLMYACMDSHVQSGALRVILDNLLNKENMASVDPLELLHYAVKNSQCEVIHFLVAYFHMDVRKFSPVDGNTPLHWAACGRIRAISTLLFLGADVNSINRQGATPLILAATCGRVEAVRILLRHGANTSIATSVEQYTVWHIAAQRGFVDILQELIANYQAGGSATGFLAVDAEGNTPLHWTCRQCDALSAILALEGVDLEVANQNGETPLLLVARFGVSDAVRLLLQLGADLQRVTSQGDTAVHVAVRCNHVHVVRELVSHPACPIETTNNAGLTPLLLACTHCAGAVPILLSCGADVTRRTRSDNETALHLAVRQGEAGVVEELLARCPYVDSLMVENVNWIHPYQLAVNLRSSSIVELNFKSDSVWYMNKAAQRLRVLDLLEAAMKGGLNWRRKRNYAMFLSGVLHSEQLLLSVPAGRKAIEEVFKGQDMRMLIGKFI